MTSSHPMTSAVPIPCKKSVPGTANVPGTERHPVLIGVTVVGERFCKFYGVIVKVWRPIRRSFSL